MLKTDVADLLLKKYGKKNPPMVKPGETVKVFQKIKEGEKERVQIFEGLVIAVKHGRGLNGTFTVRKIAVGGIGVERTYPLHSPNVVKVERTKAAKVSRAKLYYMRDRKGKNARFKVESAAALTWEEPMAEPINVEEENVIAEETVEEMIEETPVAEVAETPAEEAAAETTETPEIEPATEPEEPTQAEPVAEETAEETPAEEPAAEEDTK